MQTSLIILLALGLSAKAATVNLAWDPSPTPSVTYRVYQASDTPTSFAPVLGGLTGTTASFDYNAMVTNFWRVTAVDTNGVESLPSNTVSLEPAPVAVPPAPPTNLRANAVGIARIDIGWALSAPATVKVERSAKNTNSFAEVGSVAPGTSYFINGGLARNTLYYFRLRAVNDAGSSPYSAIFAERTEKR